MMTPATSITALTRGHALRQAVAADRVRLNMALTRLKTAVRERTDVGQHMARRPYVWLAGSFLVGMLWGATTRSRNH